MKFQSINDFKGQSIEKESLGNFIGGYCCSTEGGNNPVIGAYSADTATYNDTSGAFETNTYHNQVGDKSTCDDDGRTVQG